MDFTRGTGFAPNMEAGDATGGPASATGGYRATLLRQFATAMEHSAIGTALVSLDGNWLQSNLALRNLLGYAQTELHSKTFQEITHPDDLDADLDLVAKVLDGSIRTYQLDKRYIRKDGSFVWAQLTVSLASDDAGKPSHFISQIQDISSRKAAEFQQRELTERLSLAIRAGGVGVWELDLTTESTICDARMHELYGLEPGNLGDSLSCWTDPIIPEDLPAVQSQLAACIAGSDTFETQFRVTWKDGQVRHISGLAVTLREDDGSCPRLVGINWDVTHLVELAADADAANRAKSEFLATISHELRTPLHGIIGFADLLQSDDLAPADRQTYLQHLADAGKSLLTIVNDVLDISKIDAKKLELERTQVDVARIVRGCEALVRKESEEKGLALDTRIDADVPLWIMGDGTRLRQVLLNLSVNAVKFTASGGVRLRVCRGADETRLRFEVSDSGIGISKDDQAKLFRDFSQADASTSRKFGGTGLGLAICKRIVEQMGGEIGVESALERGSTFWFEVPVERFEDHVQSAEPVRPAAGALSILVAEDVDVNQELARAILERHGHEVKIVENGLEAVAAALAGQYDLILMDIQMPEMDGVAATRAIRSCEADDVRTPIWAMTANALSEKLVEYMAAGMDGHITKPFDSARLQEKLREFQRARGAEAAIEILNIGTLQEMIEVVGMKTGAFVLSGSAKAIKASICALAVAGASAETVAGEAHKIISVAGNVGLDRLAWMARKLQQSALAGSDLSLVAAIRAEADRGIAALQPYIRSATEPGRV